MFNIYKYKYTTYYKYICTVEMGINYKDIYTDINLIVVNTMFDPEDYPLYTDIFLENF